jgi:hypothetical protein
MEVDTPFYNNSLGPDPEVNSTSDPYEGFWEYEVVEAFFLGENEEYIEIELSPSGHYLIYYLKGRRNPINQTLPLPNAPSVEIVNTTDTESPTGQRWLAQAYIPAEFFPCFMHKFNSYAIHLSRSDGENKTYMSVQL